MKPSRFANNRNRKDGELKRTLIVARSYIVY